MNTKRKKVVQMLSTGLVVVGFMLGAFSLWLMMTNEVNVVSVMILLLAEIGAFVIAIAILYLLWYVIPPTPLEKYNSQHRKMVLMSIDDFDDIIGETGEKKGGDENG